MGASVSKALEFLERPKMKRARTRLRKLITTAWWLGGNFTWTMLTAGIVLAVPVFFEYERECQMFEQMAQAQKDQMNAVEKI
mmetsp:Transcript_22160/g.50685  ORF Transcript_22160/g.50685 Transcript_22160/m.50685 type:complete len:82 (+) Transcript_22160:109-354(+)